MSEERLVGLLEGLAARVQLLEDEADQPPPMERQFTQEFLTWVDKVRAAGRADNPFAVCTDQFQKHNQVIFKLITPADIAELERTPAGQRIKQAAAKSWQVFNLPSTVAKGIAEEAGFSPNVAKWAGRGANALDWAIPGVPAGSLVLAGVSIAKRPASAVLGVRRAIRELLGIVVTEALRIMAAELPEVDDFKSREALIQIGKYLEPYGDEEDNPDRDWAMVVLMLAFAELGDLAKSIATAEKVLASQ